MVNVGVIGLGMMGQAHLDVYAQCEDARVVAVAARDDAKLKGEERTQGNIEGSSAGRFDFTNVKKYTEGYELIADADVELVDICLPTPMHLAYATAALEAGKHVLLEKPVTRTAAEAAELAAAAEQAKGYIMPAMCIRFWPAYAWLKQVVASKKYGRVLGAAFRRLSPHPGREHPLYGDGQASGGALLDLHIHDADFVAYCFGLPRAVTSFGYSHITGEPDHVLTRYHFDQHPLVTAEGGWLSGDTLGFRHDFTVNFERATAEFNRADDEALIVHHTSGSEPERIELVPGSGWQHEIDYFLKCVQTGTAPQVVDMPAAVRSMRLIEAEQRSLASGGAVDVERG